MAPIPPDLLYVEVVVDTAGLAHKLGTTPVADQASAAVRQSIRTPDRYSTRCAPDGGLFAPMSAYTAHRRGAAACPAEACFGPAPADGDIR